MMTRKKYQYQIWGDYFFRLILHHYCHQKEEDIRWEHFREAGRFDVYLRTRFQILFRQELERRELKRERGKKIVIVSLLFKNG